MASSIPNDRSGRLVEHHSVLAEVQAIMEAHGNPGPLSAVEMSEQSPEQPARRLSWLCAAVQRVASVRAIRLGRSS